MLVEALCSVCQCFNHRAYFLASFALGGALFALIDKKFIALIKYAVATSAVFLLMNLHWLPILFTVETAENTTADIVTSAVSLGADSRLSIDSFLTGRNSLFNRQVESILHGWNLSFIFYLYVFTWFCGLFFLSKANRIVFGGVLIIIPLLVLLNENREILNLIPLDQLFVICLDLSQLQHCVRHCYSVSARKNFRAF